MRFSLAIVATAVVVAVSFAGCNSAKSVPDSERGKSSAPVLENFGKQLFDSYDPLSAEQIAKFEAELGAKLPDDYFRFLLTKNGGRVRDDWSCRVKQPTEWVETCNPTTFFSLDASDRRSLRKMQHEFEGRVPDWFLPIADSDADIIGLAISGERKGQVIFWACSEDTMHTAPQGANLFAVAGGFTDFVASLRLPPDREENLIETVPIFRAVESSDLAAIRKYLDQGGDIEVRNDRGRTLLGAATAWVRPDVVPLLLERGADREARDASGCTPLRQAVDTTFVDGVKMLLAAGANPNSVDDQGVGILEAARKLYADRIVALLESTKKP